MNPNTPAANQKEMERRIESVTLCGKNRGPHDYIPIAWVRSENSESVSTLMCRVCFCRVQFKTLYENFPEVRI